MKYAKGEINYDKKNPLICPICKKTDVDFELDHIQPLSRGGTAHPSNLWYICKRCNREKGTKTLYEFIVERFKR